MRIWKMAEPIIRIVAPMFFDKKYLQGRHFETGGEGWRWVAKGIWIQKFLMFNRKVPWPVTKLSTIGEPRNIVFHPDDLNNFQSPGCYFQTLGGKIVIGKGTYIGPNVGFITANHDPLNLDEHLPGGDIVLGRYCWIGMNSVIMPGVVLGDRTIVGAGSVVTRSFPQGNCLIAGNPARFIKSLGN